MELVVIVGMLVAYIIYVRNTPIMGSIAKHIRNLVIFMMTIMVMLGATQVLAADVYYDREYAAVVIEGPIEPKDEEKLSQVLSKNEGMIDWVTLHSEGGSIEAGLLMAGMIREAELNTYVPQFCASACTMIFMGGKERAIDTQAQMQYHFSYVPEENVEENISKSEYYFWGQYGAYWVVQEYILSVEESKTKSALQYMMSLLIDSSPEKLNQADNDKLLESGIVTKIY